MPTASERLVWAQGGPEDVKLITTTLPSRPTTPLNISATICWENYMPLLRQHLYDQGTQLYCAPTVDGREVWLSSMTHIALEGRCFVLSACQMSIRTILSWAFFTFTYLTVCFRFG
jgi:predicted amidohydrolase